jgi:CRP-like cAMP-binding protein
MKTIKLQEPSPANKLLTALPEKEYQRILPHLELIDLLSGDVLFNPGDEIRDVYFPTSSVVSLLAVENLSTLETGLVGNEGMIGLPVFLEVSKSRGLAVVQGSGSALKMKTADFLAECKQNDLLSRLLRRYTHYLLMQVSHNVICARLHLLEGRLANLLLLMRDRVMRNQFQFKQEFLAQMLGVRRGAISIAAGNFQNQRLISYSRGNLSIVDPEGLEKLCCQCYEYISREYREFIVAQHQLN